MASADIISTTNKWPNYSVGNSATAGSSSAANSDSSTIGKDQFLKILITQLQNQDPTAPMEDKEFIAQMAQFTSLEQLMNISDQLTAMNQSLGSVSGLIGKEITWTGSDTGLETSGIVDSILISNNIQYAVVGDERIPLTDVTKIKEAESTDNSEESEATS